MRRTSLYKADPVSQNAAMYSDLTSASEVADHSYPIGEQRSGHSDRRFLLLSAILIVAALITRRPDAVLHPQFWAEDGKFFYAGAYEYGWRSLMSTQAGYFLTLQRLVAMASLAVPLRWAPLLMNLIAIAIQAIPPIFLLSRRFDFVGTRRLRSLMAVLLLAIPTAPEVHATITNAHWHLALAAFMVLVAQPPGGTTWRFFDCIVLLLSGISGPFCIFLLPVAVVILWVRRNRWAGVLLAIVSATVALQVPAIVLTSVKARLHEPLGASPMLLVRITGSQIVLESLLGPKFTLRHPHSTETAAILASAGAIALMAYMLRTAPVDLRLLAGFGACVAAAGLWSPLVSINQPQWPVMLLPYAGARYWYFLVLGWLWTLLWLAGRERPAIVRILGALALAAALKTGAWYWKYPRFADLAFPKYASDFQRLPAGQYIQIPINPPGTYMVLRKH